MYYAKLPKLIRIENTFLRILLTSHRMNISWNTVGEYLIKSLVIGIMLPEQFYCNDKSINGLFCVWERKSKCVCIGIF